MKASAGFVSASALGMACGPALASLFRIKFKVFKLTFNEDTLPGWIMAFAWLVYLVWLWISFREPVQEDERISEQRTRSGTFILPFNTAINYISYFYLFYTLENYFAFLLI